MSGQARTITVIETNLLMRGSGKDASSPLRDVFQLWDGSGKLLYEDDPAAVSLTPEQLLELDHLADENATTAPSKLIDIILGRGKVLPFPTTP